MSRNLFIYIKNYDASMQLLPSYVPKDIYVLNIGVFHTRKRPMLPLIYSKSYFFKFDVKSYNFDLFISTNELLFIRLQQFNLLAYFTDTMSIALA